MTNDANTWASFKVLNLYVNSTNGRFIMLIIFKNVPGVSLMIMCKRDSLSSPMSLLSVTNRSLPKSILAPLQIAISFFFEDFVSATHLFKPAKDNAPDGSKIERVSPNVSFMAAQISSLVTTTISSTKFLQIL
eukprot:NODE_428_length_7645_cov_0.433740.p7 type:complete len:133 gc:universal NODE_428_length_7645_cov_0.433740:221-619(+)